MTEFELEQRRASRQLKCFSAGQLVRKIMGLPDPRPGTDAARIEEVRQAALSGLAESRAALQALLAKGIITEEERQDFLDWGYDSILAQLHAGRASKVMEAGRG